VSATDLGGELARVREEQQAVSDVLAAVARGHGLQPVFDAVVGAANRLCDGDSCGLWLFDGEVFRAEALIGASAPTLGWEREHPHAPGRDTLTGRVALTRELVHIPDVVADPEYDWPGQRFGTYRSMLGVPIFVGEDLIGVMAVTRTRPGPFSDDAIRLVTTFADQAAIALANARLLDAVERQRTELSRFVSPSVAELISSNDGARLLEGHRAYISVFFSDLRGFTAFAETAAPEELFEILREYHALIGALVGAHDGTVEHFAGDGVMAFFNDPAPVPEHELQAIRMALALQERFGGLATLWRKRGTDLGLGIGIAAGYATLGRIGFEGRYDYGALGPVTNLASRLSTRARSGQTLISQRVYAAVEEAVDAEPVGELELKGFGRPVAAYVVRGLRSAGAA
jgi:class 3 adenylate cyclase/putative methionine-R-sulfoxide reductase with GAF domain